jgi:hypothetical protein
MLLAVASEYHPPSTVCDAHQPLPILPSGVFCSCAPLISWCWLYGLSCRWTGSLDKLQANVVRGVGRINADLIKTFAPGGWLVGGCGHQMLGQLVSKRVFPWFVSTYAPLALVCLPALRS